jgi:hypothetical protein
MSKMEIARSKTLGGKSDQNEFLKDLQGKMAGFEEVAVV